MGDGHAVPYYTSMYADHLYPQCPILRRSHPLGGPFTDFSNFDPFHPTVCGWCQRVYRSRSGASLGETEHG